MALSRITAPDAADRLAHHGGFLVKRGGTQAGGWVDGPFPAAVVYGQIGDVSVCRLSAPPHTVKRRSESIRVGDRQFAKLVLQLRGSAELEQNGRRVTLSPGEWSFYDPAQTYAIENHQDVAQLVLLAPRDAIWHGASSLFAEALLTVFGSNPGLERITSNYLITMADEMLSLSEAAMADIAESILSLLRRSISERIGSGRLYSQRDILKDRIRHYLDRHLNNAELSIDTIAGVMNCTKRNLHKAFADEPITIGQMITDMRLERCRIDLRDPRMAKRSVIDVAFSWGFNNAAHFSRVFREKYGISPRGYRTQQLIQSPDRDLH